MAWTADEREARLMEILAEMKTTFEDDPEVAVRGQGFIQKFHGFIAEDLRSHITKRATKAGVKGLFADEGVVVVGASVAG